MKFANLELGFQFWKESEEKKGKESVMGVGEREEVGERGEEGDNGKFEKWITFR